METEWSFSNKVLTSNFYFLAMTWSHKVAVYDCSIQLVSEEVICCWLHFHYSLNFLLFFQKFFKFLQFLWRDIIFFELMVLFSCVGSATGHRFSNTTRQNFWHLGYISTFLRNLKDYQIIFYLEYLKAVLWSVAAVMPGEHVSWIDKPETDHLVSASFEQSTCRLWSCPFHCISIVVL